MVVIILCSWILDLTHSTDIKFYTALGILKVILLYPATVPLFVYLFRERKRRIKKVNEFNSDVKNLEQILTKPISRVYFREFLKQAQMEHFVDCYIHISLFKQDPPSNEKIDYEDWIYETFISFGAFSISVPPNVLEDIQRRLKKSDNCVFDKAQKSLIVNLQTNNYFKDYLMSKFSENARKLNEVLASVKSRDLHIRDVLKDISLELIQKKKTKKKKENHRSSSSISRSRRSSGGIAGNAVAPDPGK